MIQRRGQALGQFYVTNRWLGGTLTNFKTVKGSIERLRSIEKMAEDGTFERLTKKEVLGIDARARQAGEGPRRHQGHGRAAGRGVHHRPEEGAHRRRARRASSRSRSSPSSTPTAIPTSSTTSSPATTTPSAPSSCSPARSPTPASSGRRSRPASAPSAAAPRRDEGEDEAGDHPRLVGRRRPARSRSCRAGAASMPAPEAAATPERRRATKRPARSCAQGDGALMAEITASMIKDLRERTGAGMSDCKKALTECDGDMEKAIEYLRKKGLAAGRQEGRPHRHRGRRSPSYIHGGAHRRAARGQLRDRLRRQDRRLPGASSRTSRCTSPARIRRRSTSREAEITRRRSRRSARSASRRPNPKQVPGEKPRSRGDDPEDRRGQMAKWKKEVCLLDQIWVQRPRGQEDHRRAAHRARRQDRREHQDPPLRRARSWARACEKKKRRLRRRGRRSKPDAVAASRKLGLATRSGCRRPSESPTSSAVLHGETSLRSRPRGSSASCSSSPARP